MSEKFTLDDIQNLDKAIEKARDEDKPFAVYSGDEISVVGDANKTEVVKSEYDITFMYPKDEYYERYDSVPSNGKETANFVFLKHKFTNVTVNPRNNTLLAEAIIKIVPFFQEYERLNGAFEEKLEKIEKEFNAKFINKNTDNVKTTLKDEQKNLEMMKRYLSEFEDFTTELIHFYNYSSEKIREGVYEFIGALLQLDKDALDHITGTSCLSATMQAFGKYPELWNETELLF